MKQTMYRLFIAITSFLVFPSSVFAAAAYRGLTGAADTIKDGNAGNPPTPLPVLIGQFISAILGILGIILVVYIIQAGILYMTAAGDDTKVGKAKKMITTAIIGMIIIVAAYSISSFVIDTLSGATSAQSPKGNPNPTINV